MPPPEQVAGDSRRARRVPRVFTNLPVQVVNFHPATGNLSSQEGDSVGYSRGVSRVMSRFFPGSLVFVTGLGIMASAARAQNPSGGIAQGLSACEAKLIPALQSITAEVRKLQLEMLEDRRELLAARIKEIEDELLVVQGRQREMLGDQQSRTQQVSEIESQLAQTPLSKQEREELEATQKDLLGGSEAMPGALLAQLAQREALARERLAEQEQRLQSVDRQLRQLAPSSR